MLVLAVALGILIGLPQLWASMGYFPKSVRSEKTFEQKTEIGNVPFSHFKSLIRGDRPTTIDGVLYPEMSIYTGISCAMAAICSNSWHQWVFLSSMMLLMMGKRTPIYRLVSRFCLRIPARFSYFFSLCVVFMACAGLYRLNLSHQILLLLVFVQSADLAIRTSRLWPMPGYTETSYPPSRLYNSPLTEYLKDKLGAFRVSGLPYPHFTGQVHGLRTLGYNGGSQLKAMAWFRQDKTANGAGGHDWFSLGEDGPSLDWYGVKYAYSHRDLTIAGNPGKWKKTWIPGLYRNKQVKDHVPSFSELESLFRQS